MAKLLEKNGAEMCAALVSIASTLKKFMDDPEFETAWKTATKKGLKTGDSDILKIYTSITPLLLGDKHLKDTLGILSTIEGKPVNELMSMNGTELLEDALKAFNEQLKPFFTRLGDTVGQKL